MIHTVVGLEHAEIMRPAYAVEYDYSLPHQLHPTLETNASRICILPVRSMEPPATRKQALRALSRASTRR